MTGMSGTGKSTALVELAKRGFQVGDTDDAPWSEWSDADGGYIWREDLVAELLFSRRRSDALHLRNRYVPRAHMRLLWLGVHVETRLQHATKLRAILGASP